MRKDYEASKLLDFFENLEMPDAQTPLHKQRLKRALLRNASFNLKPVPSTFDNIFLRSFSYARQHGALSIAAIALFLTVALWSIAPFTAPAFAHIILEVNPALKLTVDTNNNVIDFTALDQTAKDIFEKMDFRRKSADNAITEILDILHEKTLLEKNSNVLLVVSPVRDEKIDDIAQTISKAEMAVNRRLAELDAAAGVRTLALKTKVYSAAEQAGLMPSQYVRLLDHGMTSDTLSSLFHYADEPEIDRDYFINHFEEIAEQITLVLDKDVPEVEAVLVVREALTARRRGELRRAVSRLNELLDTDLTPKAAAAQIRDEMRSRRNLKNVEERNYENESSEDIDDGYDKEPLEDENEQPSGNGIDRNPNERINERRERLQQRREQQKDERNEQPDEVMEQQDARQNRRNERLNQQNQRRQQRNEEQKKQDKSRETSDGKYEQPDKEQYQLDEPLEQPDEEQIQSDESSETNESNYKQPAVQQTQHNKATKSANENPEDVESYEKE